MTIREQLANMMQRELDEHDYEDDDEKRWQVAYHFADMVLSLPNRKPMPDNGIREQLANKLLDCHITSKVIPIDVYEIADTVLSLPNLVVVDLDNVDELAKVAARCWPDTYANSWPWDTIPENAQNAYRKMVRDALCKGR